MSELHRCNSSAIRPVDFEPGADSSSRNHSDHAPIGEKITSSSRTPRCRRSALTLDKAKLYSYELGLTLRAPAWLYRRTWGEVTHKGYNITGHGWTAAERPASVNTIWSGLGGKFGVSVGGQETVRLIVLDLDHGHGLESSDIFPSEDAVCTCGQRYSGADSWACDCPQPDDRRQRRAASELNRRQQIAAKARPIVAKLHEAFPGVEFATFSTPRGCHVVFLLADPLPCDEAHELGERILITIGADSSEAFPKNGRLCRLPGTGSASRMLDDALEGRRHGSRIKDLEALLALRRCRPSDFGVTAIKKPSKSSTRRESTRVDSPPAAKHKTAKSRPGESINDVELRDALAVKLKGAEYEAAMLEVFRRGMPDDTSYDCMRKLAFLTAVAAGLARAECVRVADAFIALPTHRATHAQTQRGRRQLLAVFRSCLRHQQRGIAGGSLKPAQLARPALWKVLHDLLGRRPRLRIVKSLSPTTREALSDAGRKRWAKDAA